MSAGPSTPSTTPVRMREDSWEKAIWRATSSNVPGMDGDTTYKPANDRRIRTSPSPAVPYGSKGIRFRWRCRNTSPRAVCLVDLVCFVYLVDLVHLVSFVQPKTRQTRKTKQRSSYVC